MRELNPSKFLWTMDQIVEQCAAGNITKEQAHKLLDRKQEQLDQQMKRKLTKIKI